LPIPIRMQIVKDSADNAELMPGNLLSHGFTPVELTARIKAMLPESNVILVFQHSASIYVCAEVAGAVVEAMRGKPPPTGGTGVKLGQREREVLVDGHGRTGLGHGECHDERCGDQGERDASTPSRVHVPHRVTNSYEIRV